MHLNLREQLTPEMYGHGGGAAAEDTDDVILDGLDSLFGHVSSMIVGGNKFIGHRGEVDF